MLYWSVRKTPALFTLPTCQNLCNSRGERYKALKSTAISSVGVSTASHVTGSNSSHFSCQWHQHFDL
eukprot:5780610-Amphidinium_carterae.2